MKQHIRNLLLILSLFPLACSSMTILVESDPPEAEVFIKNGKASKKLGVTPLQINANDIAGFEKYNLLIQKDGYQSYEVLIDKRAVSATTEVAATLQKINSTTGTTDKVADSQVEFQHRAIASIQSQLLQNNYSQAEVLIKDFLNTNPFSPVGWNLLGNAYVLQNRNQEALEAYTRALEYDPEDKDTKKMVERLTYQPEKRGR